MRKIYHKAITVEEKDTLKRDILRNRNHSILNKPNDVVDKLVNMLSKDFEFEVKEQSYYNLEKTNNKGHKWHIDTGTDNHMMWCQVGVSLLFESDYDKDITYYREDDDIIEVYRDDLDCIAHTSDVPHKVDPPKGDRLVLLIFI